MRTDAYLFVGRSAKSNLNVAAKESFVKSSLLSRLGEFFQTLMVRVVNNSEPHISQTRDRSGQLVWHVYDSTTSQRFQFSSEGEVRAWLDQRYYF